MANRFWVGNGGNWGDYPNHWSATSGGAPGATLPTINDDVFFDVNSFSLPGQLVIVNTSGLFRHINWTGVTNNPTVRLNNDWNCFGDFLITGMSFENTGTGRFLFRSTAAAVRFITFNGISLQQHIVLFNGVGGSWQLQDSLTTLSYINQSAGTLNTNSQTVNCTEFQLSGSSTKVLTLGASVLNLSLDFFINGPWYTINAGTSAINCRGVRGYRLGPAYGYPALNLYDVSCQAPYTNYYQSGQIIVRLTGIISFHNLTITQTSSGTNTWQKTLAVMLNGNITISGNLTLTGFSQDRRIFFFSDFPGARRDLAISGTASLTNVDFIDIGMTGAGAPFSGTSVGVCGNNIGITGTPAVTRYWVGDSGNWSDTAHWSASSGGVGGATLPLPQDTVRFDVNSFSSDSQTVTCDKTILGGDIDWTGVTHNPVWRIFYTEDVGSRFIFMCGNLTLSSGMTTSYQTGSGSYTTYLMFSGRGSQQITCNGGKMGGAVDAQYNYSYLIIDTGGGSASIQDTFNCWKCGIRSGTFNAGNKNLNVTLFYIGWSDVMGANSYCFNPVLNMGSGIWYFDGSVAQPSASFVVRTYAAGTTTVNCQTSTIIVNSIYNLGSPATFTLGATTDGGTAPSLTLYDIIVYGSNGAVSNFGFSLPIYNDHTFRNLTLDKPRMQVNFTATRTYTITSTLTVQGGNASQLFYFRTTTSALTNLSAAVAILSFIDVSWNRALGVAIPFLDYGGVDSGNNVNWSFLPGPAVGVTGQVSWF